MAEEDLQLIELRDGFYRDSFGKVVLTIVGICTAIALMSVMSAYLYLYKPAPVNFQVANEFRVQPEVPLDQRYLAEPDMLQWVADAVIKTFNYDYNHYNDQLARAQNYFTADGWKIFLNQLNIYANYNNVQSNRLFINGIPAGAPIVVSQGLYSGRYAWWVRMPIMIKYAGLNPPPNKGLTLQLLVVRVSTLNNLTGIGINDVIVTQGIQNKLVGNG